MSSFLLITKTGLPISRRQACARGPGPAKRNFPLAWSSITGLKTLRIVYTAWKSLWDLPSHVIGVSLITWHVCAWTVIVWSEFAALSPLSPTVNMFTVAASTRHQHEKLIVLAHQLLHFTSSILSRDLSSLSLLSLCFYTLLNIALSHIHTRLRSLSRWHVGWTGQG